MSGAAEMQQWYKAPQPDTADTPVKGKNAQQERTSQRSPQRDHSVGGRQAGSRVFREDSKMSVKESWRSRPLPKRKKRLLAA
jgi:hypothetical protein